MENRPTIQFTGISPAPMADAELFERYQKWGAEGRAPMIMNISEVVELDRYQIIKENPEHPEELSISHYRNLKEWRTSTASFERKALAGEFQSWIERGVIEYIWSAAYALIKSFRSKPAYSGVNEDTRIENASIMYLVLLR